METNLAMNFHHQSRPSDLLTTISTETNARAQTAFEPIKPTALQPIALTTGIPHRYAGTKPQVAPLQNRYIQFIDM